MGRVSRGTWRTTGSRRHPLLSRKAPPGSGPTCSRGAGWEVRRAATAKKARAAAMRYFSGDGNVVIGNSHCKGMGMGRIGGRRAGLGRGRGGGGGGGGFGV